MVKALKCFALLIAALLLGTAGCVPVLNYRENIPVYGANCLSAEGADCNCGQYQNGNLSLPSQKTRESVYLGGMPLGLEFKTRGLIIVGKTDVVTPDGLVNPTKNSNIEAGDILLSVEGLEVNTAEELTEIINREIYRGKELKVKIRRKGQEIDTVISSVKDFSTGIFKTGLWIRQDTFGVGTLTFIRKDLRYGALGHPVVDEDTKDILYIRGGSVRPCTVAGCIKGERGKPGEIKGMIIKNAESYGSVDKNGI